MSLETINILMIEDDPGYTELLTRSLSRIKTPKLAIDTASSLPDAIAKIKLTQYEVILLDLSLGETNGIETLRRARCHVPDIPIIVLTGSDDPDLPSEAVRNGAQDYLVKHQADNHVISLAIRYAVDRRRGERLQREQLHFLQSVMDNVPCPLFIKDMGLVYRGCNAAFEKMLGIAKPNIVGRTVFDVFGEDIVENIRARELELLRTQKIQSYELTVRRQDGGASEMLFHEAAYRRGDGSLAGLVGVALDISERKQAERILIENEKYINLILNSVEVGIIVVDAETRKIVDANRNALEMIGASGRDEVADHICHSYICPAERDKCPILDLDQTVDRSERVLLKKDGGRIDVLKTVVSADINGAHFLVESFVDISMRKHMENALREANEQLEEKVRERTRKLAAANKRLREEIEERKHVEAELTRERNLFMAGPVVMFRWVATEGWPVEYVSRNVTQLLGYSSEELMSGKVFYTDIIHPEDLRRISEELETHLKANAPHFEQHYRVVKADGEVIPIYDFTVVVRGESGAITHFDGYVLKVSGLGIGKGHHSHLRRGSEEPVCV